LYSSNYRIIGWITTLSKISDLGKALRKVFLQISFGDLRSTIRRVNDLNVKKGDIFFADLSPVIGSEQGGVRPVLVVQNDVGNKSSPTIIVAAVTSQMNKAKLPTHVALNAIGNGLSKDSVILLEQLRTIDKKRLKERIGALDEELIPNVNEALSVSLGIANIF
jgi:mRNA interferase MazF